jgi:hypothetical protein
MVERGMSHAEIAERVSQDTGYTVARSTVSAALHRHGDTQPLKKYTQEIPWDVKPEHQAHYAARMLRLLGRRRAGIKNSEANDKRLDAWLSRLERDEAVTVYLPESTDGFYYIPGEWDAPDLPIRENWPDN